MYNKISLHYRERYIFEIWKEIYYSILIAAYTVNVKLQGEVNHIDT